MRPSRLVHHLRLVLCRPAGRAATAGIAAAFAAGLFACGEASERSATDAGQETVTPSGAPPVAPGRPGIGAAEGVGFGGAARVRGKIAGRDQSGPPEMDLAAPPAPDVSGAIRADVTLAGPAGAPAGASAAQLPTVAPDMIIRTGHVVVEVRALDSAITRLRELARSLGGYVANTSMESGTEQIRSATIEVKLPAARFDQALAGMSALGKVESANTTAEDVSEEYVDLSARVSNARRLEDRLVDLLARRTGKLEEVLNVERELARVRGEIERYEGRMRYLRTRAAISTLTITLHEPRPVLGPPRSPGIIAEAFRDAWRNFVGLVAGLIAASGVLVPLAGLGVLVWWLIRRWRQANPPAPARPRRAVPPEDADRAA